MFSGILILLAMPFTDLSRSRGIQFRPLSKIAFFIFAGNFLILMELGAKHVESPFIEFGQISTVIFFLYFLIAVPLTSSTENSTLEINNLEVNNLDMDKREVNNLDVISHKYEEHSSFGGSVKMYLLDLFLFINRHPLLYNILRLLVFILLSYLFYLGSGWGSGPGPASGSGSGSDSDSDGGTHHCLKKDYAPQRGPVGEGEENGERDQERT